MDKNKNYKVPKIRILHALIFAILFMVGGWAITEIYYNYFDQTEYFSLAKPIVTEKEQYLPGETTTLLLSKVSLIDSIAQAELDLRLFRQEGLDKSVPDAHISRTVTITKGEKTLEVSFALPKDLQEGIYYWQGIVAFEVRGRDKAYSFQSEKFYVKSAPESAVLATP